MDAVEILAVLDPMVGQHVHCSIPEFAQIEIDDTHSILNFIVGSKNRKVCVDRYPGETPHTVFDIYIPHKHYNLDHSAFCAGVADLSWLSRFSNEEIVVVMPGQCLKVESVDMSGENELSVYGTLQ